jgi:hypothetical protein
VGRRLDWRLGRWRLRCASRCGRGRAGHYAGGIDDRAAWGPSGWEPPAPGWAADECYTLEESEGGHCRVVRAYQEWRGYAGRWAACAAVPAALSAMLVRAEVVAQRVVCGRAPVSREGAGGVLRGRATAPTTAAAKCGRAHAVRARGRARVTATAVVRTQVWTLACAWRGRGRCGACAWARARDGDGGRAYASVDTGLCVEG